MSCHVMSFQAMRCHVVSCRVASFSHVMRWFVMSCHVMSCNAMACRVVSCYVMSCQVMSCQVMSVASCGVALYRVMPLCVMWHRVLPSISLRFTQLTICRSHVHNSHSSYSYHPYTNHSLSHQSSHALAYFYLPPTAPAFRLCLPTFSTQTSDVGLSGLITSIIIVIFDHHYQRPRLGLENEAMRALDDDDLGRLLVLVWDRATRG